MPHVWLHTNRRALSLGLILPAAATLAGAGLVAWGWSSDRQLALAAGVALIVLSDLVFVALVLMMRQPRLAYERGELLVYLTAGPPIRVPIDVVECFFQGQGPSHLPPLHGQEPETANVVVRIAESAADWQHRDVKPALGLWCQGYITIRGAWCEPLTADKLRELNAKLVAAQRECRPAREPSP